MEQAKLTYYDACMQCRLRRAKCNGKQPCQRCLQRGKECRFEERHRDSKDDLRRTVQELQNRQKNLDLVFQALATPEHAESTLQALWRREPLEQVALKLSAVPTQEPSPDGNPRTLGGLSNTDGSSRVSSNQMQQKDNKDRREVNHDAQETRKRGAPEPSRQDDNMNSAADLPTPVSDTKSANRGGNNNNNNNNNSNNNKNDNDSHHRQLNQDFEMAQRAWSISGLTVDQLRHLLGAFFECQYIPFFTIDRDMFMRDFVGGSDEYCSPALVRALLCQACRLVAGYDAAYSFLVNLGNRLFDESKSALNMITSSKFAVPDAQALGLAALHELGAGRETEALGLAEKAVERINAARGKDGQSDQSWSRPIGSSSNTNTVLLGTVTLARVIRIIARCLRSCRASQQAPTPTRRVSDLLVDDDPRLEPMLASREATDPLTRYMKPLPALCAQLICAIYRAQLQTTSQQIADGDTDDKMIPRALRDTYAECLSRYETILNNPQDESNNRPAAHFTHLLYHFCLMALFRPFCRLRATDSKIDPQGISLEAAQTVMMLSRSYNGQVLPRMAPCFVPLFVYVAGVTAAELLGHQAMGSPSSLDLSSPSSAGSLTPRQSPVRVNSQDIRTLAMAGVVEHLAAMGDVFPLARMVKEELEEVHLHKN